MRELEKPSRQMSVPAISEEKKYSPSGIPKEQKTIATVRGRIENASKTFEFFHDKTCDAVLLVDDLVGSASTLNEIARKMKKKGLTNTIHALTMVGVSSKKFPVGKRYSRVVLKKYG